MTFLQAVNSHYVYCHIRPDTDSIFYIGKGSKNRLYQSGQRNNHWKNIVLKAGGFRPIIVFNNLTELGAYELEKSFIQSARKANMKICNLVDGGKGGSFNPSIETRQKQRIAKLGKKLTNEHKKKIGLAGIGRSRSGYKLNLTGEQREHRANIARNQIWIEERKKRISMAKKGKPQSEETKQKISFAKKGKKWTNEQRINIMAGRKKVI